MLFDFINLFWGQFEFASFKEKKNSFHNSSFFPLFLDVANILSEDSFERNCENRQNFKEDCRNQHIETSKSLHPSNHNAWNEDCISHHLEIGYRENKLGADEIYGL